MLQTLENEKKSTNYNAIECCFISLGDGHTTYTIKGISEKPFQLLIQRANEIRDAFPGSYIAKQTDSFILIDLCNGQKFSLTLFKA